jgi:hypothetical protein
MTSFPANRYRFSIFTIFLEGSSVVDGGVETEA